TMRPPGPLTLNSAGSGIEVLRERPHALGPMVPGEASEAFVELGEREGRRPALGELAFGVEEEGDPQEHRRRELGVQPELVKEIPTMLRIPQDDVPVANDARLYRREVREEAVAYAAGNRELVEVTAQEGAEGVHGGDLLGAAERGARWLDQLAGEVEHPAHHVPHELERGLDRTAAVQRER